MRDTKYEHVCCFRRSFVRCWSFVVGRRSSISFFVFVLRSSSTFVRSFVRFVRSFVRFVRSFVIVVHSIAVVLSLIGSLVSLHVLSIVRVLVRCLSSPSPLLRMLSFVVSFDHRHFVLNLPCWLR